MTEPKITARLIEITPKLAAALIEHKNNHNRAVNNARVDQYANDMRHGEWRVNGEAIKIAVDGQVLDGQHRLLAVLEADTPIQTLLITGLEPETQESMDQGKARGFHDVLKLRGEKDYNVLAAAVRIVCVYERDGVPFSTGFKTAPSNHAASATLKRNPEIRDACMLANRLRRPWMPVSTMAALHFLMASADQAGADDFFTKLATGENLDATSPIYVLRERLIREHYTVDERRLQPKVKMAYAVLAWNAYQDGRTISRLKWTPGGSNPDPFPAIRGLTGDETTITDTPPRPTGSLSSSECSEPSDTSLAA